MEGENEGEEDHVNSGGTWMTVGESRRRWGRKGGSGRDKLQWVVNRKRKGLGVWRTRRPYGLMNEKKGEMEEKRDNMNLGRQSRKGINGGGGGGGRWGRWGGGGREGREKENEEKKEESVKGKWTRNREGLGGKAYSRLKRWRKLNGWNRGGGGRRGDRLGGGGGNEMTEEEEEE